MVGDLAGYHSKISDALILQRNAAGALESSLRSLEITARLAQLDESHMGRQVELAGANNKLGDVLVAQNRFGDAFAVHNRALRIYGQRVSLDPNNTELRRLSAATQLRIGSLLIAEHRYDEARPLSPGKLGLVQSDRPRQCPLADELAVAFAKNSLLRFGRLQLGLACSLMMKSLQIRRSLIAKDVANGHARNQLAVDLTNLAKLEKSRKNLHRARAAAEKAVEILQGLTQLHPDHV